MCCKKEGGKVEKDVELVVSDTSGRQREIKNPFSGSWSLPGELKPGNIVRGLVDGKDYEIITIIQGGA